MEKKENTKILVLILQIQSHEKIETMVKDKISMINYFSQLYIYICNL